MPGDIYLCQVKLSQERPAICLSSAINYFHFITLIHFPFDRYHFKSEALKSDSHSTGEDGADLTDTNA